MQRRTFLATGLAVPTVLAAANHPQTARPSLPPAAKFRISLKADAIGVGGTAGELLDAAIRHGYGALSVPAHWLENWTGSQKATFAAKAKDNDIAWGANGLPVEFRKSAEQFRADLGALPAHAKNLREIGVTRIGTWILPSHSTLSYNQNLAEHADRLRDAARILGGEGLSLGLEYIGTTALRHANRFAFLSSGMELRELIAAIGEPNVGVILDSYHWYTARETPEDLLQWSNEEIVAVDLNDANAQLSLDAQTDTARELPGATGVIDLNGFLQALVKIGYDGPLRAEPFSRTLNAMDDDLAIAATFAALKRSVDKALG
ncbi:TIM barrel protein [Neolewinella lacunae]|uniref:TIM barrel protein n=1 Tax=Neolewinella lacunae TaxID=1517758 RepID=A0A923T9M6_9BACT|nr:TIM barrel protein [Neolewinella lacunae]MBC6995233.1 TIM barrel protein [Neolewinella lacunae]MDN3635458.1 TIM barrel protein [Neolewinella lacunae]